MPGTVLIRSLLFFGLAASPGSASLARGHFHPEAAHAGGEDCGPAKIADDLAFVGAIHHRHAADIEAQQFCGGIGDWFIRISHDELGPARLSTVIAPEESDRASAECRHG